MTVRDKYNENELQIKRYRDYLKSNEIDAKVKKNSWMIQERDEHDEDLLIAEMARLCEENKQIRILSIINLAYLDDEYSITTNSVSSQFNTTGRTEAHAS